MAVAIFTGWLADKTQRRGLVALGGMSIWWLSLVVTRLIVGVRDRNLHLAVLILAWTFSGGAWHPVNGSWMANNAQSAPARSITMAVLIMSANTAGIIGAQLFQPDDGPEYRMGWSIILALVSVALIAVVVANIQYRVANRIRRRRGLPEIYHY